VQCARASVVLSASRTQPSHFARPYLVIPSSENLVGHSHTPSEGAIRDLLRDAVFVLKRDVTL